MDSNRLDELLKKYWDCETGLEEEQELRAFFSGSKVPEQYKNAAPLFRYFNESKKKSLKDDAVEGRVLQIVRPAKSKMVRLFLNSMRIAAGIAVLMVAFVVIRNEIRKTTPQEIVDTFDDPQLAFEETKKALRLISQGIGQAETEARKINMFNEAREEIKKSETDSL
jgi:hypothetical protein